MKEKFIQFMQGRYGGADKLNTHLMYLLFILVIIELFTGSKPLMILSLFLMFYIYFRMFSKNIYKRYAENQKYVQFIAPITKKVNFFKKKEKIKHINTISVLHVNKLSVYPKDAERLKLVVQSVILSLSKELRGTKYVEGITYSSFR